MENHLKSVHKAKHKQKVPQDQDLCNGQASETEESEEVYPVVMVKSSEPHKLIQIKSSIELPEYRVFQDIDSIEENLPSEVDQEPYEDGSQHSNGAVVPHNVKQIAENIVQYLENEDIKYDNSEASFQSEDVRLDSTEDTDSETQKGESFKCGECGKVFASRRVLDRHIPIHTKPFTCEVCNKAFGRIDGLKFHMLAHTNDGPHKCDVCGLCCRKPSDLRNHMRTHTGEKPFKCDICGKGFARSSTLNRHAMTHTGEKPFQCEICFESFVRKHTLKIHMKIHTGEKPHVCDLCGRSFARLDYLKAHSATHTGIKRKKPGSAKEKGVNLITSPLTEDDSKEPIEESTNTLATGPLLNA